MRFLFRLVPGTRVIQEVDLELSKQELKQEINNGEYNILEVMRMEGRTYVHEDMDHVNSLSEKLIIQGSGFSSNLNTYINSIYTHS